MIKCYTLGGVCMKINSINSNTTLVNNFSELEEVFATIIKKEHVRKR